MGFGEKVYKGAKCAICANQQRYVENNLCTRCKCYKTDLPKLDPPPKKQLADWGR